MLTFNRILIDCDGKNQYHEHMSKRALYIFLVTMFATTTVSAESFSDVDENTTFYQAIEYLHENGLVNGNDDGTFAPDRSLNRAEMLKMVLEGSAATEDEISEFETTACFDDVPAGEWFTKYVCYGKEQGFVRGYEDNTFKPSQAVTFAEALKMAYAAAEIDFTENEGDEPWYKNLVDLAAGDLYIPPTISDFNQELKRAEMAELRTRMILKEDEEAFEEHIESLGDLGEVIITYETIEDAADFTGLEVEVIETN